MFTSMRKGERHEQWTSSRETKITSSPCRIKKGEEERVLLIVLTHISLLLLRIGSGNFVANVCLRPWTLPQVVLGAEDIWSQRVSKVHHRNTIAPFFMMMCVRTETSQDSEKLVTTHAPPLFGADDQYWNIGTLPLVQLALCAHDQLSGERNTCTGAKKKPYSIHND